MAIALEVVLNVVWIWPPAPCSAVIEATAISAAIKPYSIAVAAALLRSSFAKVFMVSALFLFLPELWSAAVKAGSTGLVSADG